MGRSCVVCVVVAGGGMDRRMFRRGIVMFIGSIIRWYRGDYNISITIIIIL